MVIGRRVRVVALYAAAGALIGMAGSIAVEDNARLWAGLTPLTQPLTARGVHSSFVAVWDEPHEIIVTVPAPSGIPEVDAFVASAAEHIGYQERPSFDLEWRVRQGEVLVGSGSGRSGAQGLQFGDRSRGFTFGTFPVKAGSTYDVAVDVGPGLRPLLHAAPSVEVGVAAATTSVGLALGESFREMAAWLIGAIGVGVLAAALWYHRPWRAAQQRGADKVRIV